jgi:hypothetical protein
MKKEFVPYKLALELKQLGFDEPCFAVYYSKDKSFSWHHHIDHTNDEPVLDSGEYNISAPLFQQAFRWFREKYELYSFVFKFDEGFGYETYKEGVTQTNESFDTYEEAESACLQKLIEIVKTK